MSKRKLFDSIKALFFCFMILDLAILAGCSTTYSMKGGEQLKPDEMGVLSDKFPALKPWVFVTGVDGVPRGYGIYKSFQLVPGVRTLQVRGNSQLYLYGDTVNLSLVVRPGGKYELKFERLSEPHTWRAWIEDESDGKTVSY